MSTQIPTKTYKGRLCTDQLACNEFWDGKQKFKRPEPHPTIDGLFYHRMKNGRPLWVTLERLEKDKENDRKYAQNNPEKIVEKNRNYYQNNREKVAEWARKWAQDNPERYAEARRKWRQDNSEKIVETNRKYRQNNPEKFAAYTARYKASKLKNDYDEFGNCTRSQSDDLFYEQHGAHSRRLKACLGVDFDINHIFPLANGGGHVSSNFQTIPARLNRQIGDRHAIRWGAPYGLKNNPSAFDKIL